MASRSATPGPSAAAKTADAVCDRVRRACSDPTKDRTESPSGKPMKLFSKPVARLDPKHAMWPILCWLPVVRPPKLYPSFR